MRALFLAVFSAGLLLGCGSSTKYSAMRREFGGRVDFPGWPAPGPGVKGYNLYLSAGPKGPWEKINDAPLGGGKMMVPYLDPGHEYYFYLTSIASSGVESRPSTVFRRKAVASKNPG